MAELKPTTQLMIEGTPEDFLTPLLMMMQQGTKEASMAAFREELAAFVAYGLEPTLRRILNPEPEITFGEGFHDGL